MDVNFSTKVYSKWILAGEHAVLRGCPALVFPLPCRELTLTHVESDEPLSFRFEGQHGEDLGLIFGGVLERAFKQLQLESHDIRGKLVLHNNVPIGAGLGASATVCVAIAKWLFHRGLLASSKLHEFAKGLEDLFHGESSGVDIAVVLSGQGIHFERNGNSYPLIPQWQPKWYLSYSGYRGVTSECVKRVKKLFSTNSALAEEIDVQMAKAVKLAEEALAGTNETGMSNLILAINLANDCFERWGLIDRELECHLEFLRSQGAAAVKPTGSGSGGYALSLWHEEPPANINAMLFPC